MEDEMFLGHTNKFAELLAEYIGYNSIYFKS